MSDPGPRTAQVLAVLDGAAAGAVAIELSSTLAHALQRDLGLVYVESARALVAAALPFTQALAHAGSPWVPLTTQAVEQGFRADAARLRALAARIAVRHAVSWSLRVTRGTLSEAAADLGAESDLLLLASSPPPGPPGFGAMGQARRRAVVTFVADGGEAGERARGVAARLAQALTGVVETVHLDAELKPLALAGTVAPLTRSDVLVLARDRLEPGILALLRCAVLLVG